MPMRRDVDRCDPGCGLCSEAEISLRMSRSGVVADFFTARGMSEIVRRSGLADNARQQLPLRSAPHPSRFNRAIMADSGAPLSDHFDGRRFHNPRRRMRGFADLVRWIRSRQQGPWPAWMENSPGNAPPPRIPRDSDPADALRLTFVGHMTFLLQWQSLNILTDPIWSARASPVQFMGPRRVCAPGILFEDLPKIDVVLLSHNHYDHMDLATLARLAPVPVLTPLGNDAILTRHDKRIQARALDWGQSAEVGGCQVTCEPALHWSARGRGDRRMALWGSFMISGPAGCVFFAGDTGYGDGSLFPAIAARHERIRLALLPIGAYAPRWFMKDQHCDPDEAVAIFQALRAERAFGCHWGTFRLTDEPYDEPPRRLAEALAKAGIAAERFVAPPAGGVVDIS